MKVNELCILPSGYITFQRKLTDIKFGNYTVAKNGCGLIALYNALLMAGKKPDFESLLKFLEKTLLFGGRFGVSIIPIICNLIKNGLKPSVLLSKDKFKDCEVGIINYRTTNGWWHYVAFKRYYNDTYQVVNAVTTRASEFVTMDEFVEKYVDKYVFIIKVK